MCQVLAGANERGYVVPVFRMMQNKRKHLGHLGKTPDCSNVQDLYGMDIFSTTSALLLLLLLLPGVVSLSPPHLLFLLSLYSNSSVFLRVPFRPQRLGFRHGPSHPFTPSHPISSDNCFFCLQNGSRQIPYMSVLHYSLHFLSCCHCCLAPAPYGRWTRSNRRSHNKRAQKWHCLDIPFHLYTDSRDFSTIQFFH